MASFKVRLITDEDDDLKTYFVNTMARRKRRPGFEEVNILLACDPTGLFVGELNGKPMCILALIKYDSSYCHFSSYFVEEEYRGNGYGMQLYKTALKGLSSSHNIVGYVVDDMLPKFKARSGFQAHWKTVVYDLDLVSAAKILNQSTLSDAYRVQTVDKIDMQALLNYDAAVFGYQRQKFLQTFLRAQGTHARVAINGEGQIVGYTSARVSFIEQQGSLLGPLYADSLEIAQVLLKGLFEEMLEKATSSSTSIVVLAPGDKNAAGRKLFEMLLGGKAVFNLTFMATKAIPNGRFENWFALVGGDIG